MTTMVTICIGFCSILLLQSVVVSSYVSSPLSSFASLTSQRHGRIQPLPFPPLPSSSTTPSSMLRMQLDPTILSDLLSSSLSTSSTSTIITPSSTNIIINAIQSETDPFQYLFMFPVMTLIASTCQLAGIGGAAVLSPVLLLIFPLLGPSYPLATPSAAIASALLTEAFGFASGLFGYANRGLVVWEWSIRYLLVCIPFALLGAVLAAPLAGNVVLLRGLYSVLMLGLSYLLLFGEKPSAILEEECEVPDDIPTIGRIQTSDGKTEYMYRKPDSWTISTFTVTSIGALLTGLLGVGVGETVLPQLIRKSCLPLPPAAGTSVAVVVGAAVPAAIVQFAALAAIVMVSSSDGGSGGSFTSESGGFVEGLVSVIPWSLVQFTIPGALLGGQIAPWIASKQIFKDEDIEKFAAVLFGSIGIAFAIKCIQG